jgi:serine/threonine-protein kinase
VLVAADLTAVVSATPAFDDVVPVGAVLRTDPIAGTSLTVSAQVTLVLSGGPAPVTIPDVSGKSAEDAANKLTVAGFSLGPPQKTFDPKAQSGSVLGSSPEAGTEVPKGTEVSLKIADALAVPDVRGTSTKDAVKLLEKAGFTVTVGDPAFDAGIDSGDILRTDPGPGTWIDPNNAKVFLVPSNAVKVPDLTGGTVKQAQQKLDKLGLELSVTSFFGGDDASIWNQSPGAGGRVEPGGSVSATAFP